MNNKDKYIKRDFEITNLALKNLKSLMDNQTGKEFKTHLNRLFEELLLDSEGVVKYFSCFGCETSIINFSKFEPMPTNNIIYDDSNNISFQILIKPENEDILEGCYTGDIAIIFIQLNKAFIFHYEI